MDGTSILPDKDFRAAIFPPSMQRWHDNPTMRIHPSRPWGLYLVTFISAVCAAASAVFWVLGNHRVSDQRAPKIPIVSTSVVPDIQTVARALGGGGVVSAATAPTSSMQFQLLGVVAGPAGKGLALLAVGNAPPRAYAVGAGLGDGQVLQSVSVRGVKIGKTVQGEATLELSLPKPTGA